MLDLAGANTKCKGTKCPVRGSVTVSTNYGASREGEALFRADNMNDSLTFITQSEICQSKGLDIIFESNALRARISFFNELSYVPEVFPWGCRYILTEVNVDQFDEQKGKADVISGCQGTIGSSNFAICIPQSFKCLLGVSGSATDAHLLRPTTDSLER